MTPQSLDSSKKTSTGRRPVPEAITRSVGLRRDGRLLDAITVAESALAEARAAELDTPFEHRVLLGLTLADLYLVAEHLNRAQSLLADEISFAEQILLMIRRGGSAEQIRAASIGCLRLRDRATQLRLLGHPAPEIDDVQDWLVGRPTTLAESRGRVVLVEFWARWCRGCMAMLPVLRDMHDRYDRHGLTVLALTRYGPAERGSDAERTRERELIGQAVGHAGERLIVGIAPNGRLQQIYGANRMPAATLVNRAGTVRFASSISNKNILEDHIIGLLREAQ